MFEKGLLNLTSWTGNVMMPTIAGLLLAAAIYRYSKKQEYGRLAYGAFASLMCSSLLRALERFCNQATSNDPDRLWIAVMGLVNWTGNVLLPLYGVLQVAVMVLHFAGVLERATIGQAWVRNACTAMACFGLSGILRLAEFFILHGKGGVQ